ncbi:hypothetical protein FB480_106136 [Agrobacterium vitis]|nr:hypothetical protein FB480_106136 [Agrobacterium vitis]
MTRSSSDLLYHRHRFPAEIIAHDVWLYFRFALSLRMVEDLLAARGTIISHQPVRRRERIMKRFKSARHLQRFASIHDPVANFFQIPRHEISSDSHSHLRTHGMRMWNEIARLHAA